MMKLLRNAFFFGPWMPARARRRQRALLVFTRCAPNTLIEAATQTTDRGFAWPADAGKV